MYGRLGKVFSLFMLSLVAVLVC